MKFQTEVSIGVLDYFEYVQILTSKFTFSFHNFGASFLVSAHILLSRNLAIHIAEGLNPPVIKVRLHILHTVIPMLLRPARPSQHVVPAAPSTFLEMK